MAEQKRTQDTALKVSEAPTQEITERNIADMVLSRIDELQREGALILPPNYIASNALKSAWLTLLETKDRESKPALQVCTKESVANALLNMVIQGLTPAKTQCYFIVYGNQLQMQRSYFGTIAVLKRLAGVEDVFAQVIYADDEFEYAIEGGNKVVTRHAQRLENIDNARIVGAYAVIIRGGRKFCEIMNKAQIDMSWSKRKNNGAVQKDFPEEMAKRTVVNRAAKMFVNTSDDGEILCGAINATTRDEYEPDALEQANNTAAIHGNARPLAIAAPTAPIPSATGHSESLPRPELLVESAVPAADPGF